METAIVMSGHHDHHHHSHSHGHASKNISVAFFLNAFFVVVEVVGGLLTNSIAILTDALHDLGDCLSLATAWFLQRKSAQGRDLHYSYGYRRFSLLGSVFLSGVLTVSSLFVLVEAVRRILAPQPVLAEGMLWVAVFGVIINGAAALRLKHGTSLNERAVYLHIMEDVLGWVAVLAVSVVLQFADVPVLDALLSVGISLWVLYNVYRNLRSAFHILLQGTPDDLPVGELKARIEALPEVDALHDLHVWSLDGEAHVMTLHLVTDAADLPSLKASVLEVARAYGVVHTTIEFERIGCICTTNCDTALPC